MIFIILILLISKGQQVTLVPAAYDDRSACLTAEGQIATLAEHDPEILGWTFVGEPCRAIPAPSKV